MAFLECGRAISDLAQPAVSNGNVTEFGEFPWHTGIYEYNTTSGGYEQICGGTLISPKVVISAAHCFSIEAKQSRKIFIKELSTIKVGLGKYYRSLNATNDILAQIEDVSFMKIFLQNFFAHSKYFFF